MRLGLKNTHETGIENIVMRLELKNTHETRIKKYTTVAMPQEITGMVKIHVHGLGNYIDEELRQGGSCEELCTICIIQNSFII